MKAKSEKKGAAAGAANVPGGEAGPFIFRTPAGVRDLESQPVLQALLDATWTRHLTGFTQQGIAGNPWNSTNTPVTTNYFNPADGTPAGANAGPQPVNWFAFPGRLAYNYPSLLQPALNQLADTGAMPSQISGTPCDPGPANVAYYPYGPRGWQDEYCEWAVTRNGENQITRIDFTCENPEYWNTLWQIDRNKVLELYQTVLGKPQITMNDLELQGNPQPIDPATGQPYYNPLNIWNSGTVSGATSGGAMHLTSTPNTLQTEIGISSAATVLRNNPSGSTGNTVWQSPAQNNALLCDAQYGQKFRNSDPTIGAGINGYVNDGYTLSITNPPGLYIQMPDFSNYVTPDGTDASTFWTIVRGTKTLNDLNNNQLPGNFILHAVFEVPADKGYTVSDIQIQGNNITWASQIASTFQMQVLVDAYPATVPPGYNAVGTPADSYAQPQQLFYADYYTSMYNTMVPNPVNNPISELSNSTFIAPDMLPGTQNKAMVLTCATCTAVENEPSTYPTVTFDDPAITATVTGVATGITYAVPGNSQPQNTYTSLYLSVSATQAANPGQHGVYVTNPGQSQNAVMPALLNIALYFSATVASNQSWQGTGFVINNQTLKMNISYLSGAWTANPNDNNGQLYGPAGNPVFINAKPGYTMPGENEGALIGKVGNTVFLIGAGITLPANLSGELMLCINDDLNDVYGPGLADNIGSITVTVSQA